MMVVVDEWARRARLVRRRLAERFAEEGRPHPGFCAALVVARGERGLTVEEMAAELGCGPAVLEALEQGLLPPEQAPPAVRELVAEVADDIAALDRLADPTGAASLTGVARPRLVGAELQRALSVRPGTYGSQRMVAAFLRVLQSARPEPEADVDAEAAPSGRHDAGDAARSLPRSASSAARRRRSRRAAADEPGAPDAGD